MHTEPTPTPPTPQTPQTQATKPAQSTKPAQPGRQSGQALVETVVVAIAMLPLLVGVALVGKVLDARQATIVASRAAAFECTVRPAECADPSMRAALAGQMRQRLFGRNEPAAVEASVPDNGHWGRAGWTDRGGRALLADPRTLSLEVAPQRLDAPRSHLAASNAHIAQGAVHLLDDVAGPARFGLHTWDGLYAARTGMQLRTTELGAALPGGTLRLNARTVVLADAWTASGPQDGADSVRARVEAGWKIGPLEPVWDAGYAGARALMLTMGALRLEPAASAYRHHHVDMDIVPADRRRSP